MKKTLNFRNIFLLLVASFLMLTSHAPLMAQKESQGDCLVDVPAYDPEPADNGVWCYVNLTGYKLRIAFHIVRSASNTGGTTTAQLDAAIALMKQDFGNSILFDVVSVDYIKSTPSKNYFIDNAYKLSTSGGPTPPLFFDLVAENVVPNALNVYLGPSSNTFDGGIASPSRLACTIAGTRTESSGSNYLVTSHGLSHEVAHLLGLLHTFQRQSTENASVPPLVNGQDCGTTGDLVCDTPVDPSQPRTDLVNTFDFRPLLANCMWSNTTKVDPNGTLYQPSTSNIMAYTHVSCMANFTGGQFRKMHNYCLTSSDVAPAVTTFWNGGYPCSGRGGGKGGGGYGNPTYLKALIKTGELKFMVFPNPASEFVAIQFLSDSQETNVEITDITGRSVYKKELGKTVKNTIHEIDFSVLPKGMHVLTVTNELEKKTTKFVVQ
jgi:hypothetical protein